MRHSQFVNIGKAQRNCQLAFRQVLLYLVYLAADVSAGLANLRQKLTLDLLS